MELTKYAHACALITKEDENLLIDPGAFTELPADLPKIDVLIITHAHQDHFNKTHVDRLIAANKDIEIFGTAEVASGIEQPHVTIPETDEEYHAGGFTLKFYGGQHATIHETIPPIGNFGVSVDGAVYYPGDSFSPGPENVKVLLSPAAGPWMKLSEGMDFISSQKAQLVVPTHDAFMADSGKQMHDDMLSGFAQKAGGQYKRLQPGETITI